MSLEGLIKAGGAQKGDPPVKGWVQVRQDLWTGAPGSLSFLICVMGIITVVASRE